MGYVTKTKAGHFRANWRDAAGRQRAKTLPTKREANAFLAEIETRLSRGTYVDPHAGRTRFVEYATQWMAARHHEATTMARDASIMRTHVIARWGSTPIGKIDHLAVQAWVSDLGTRLAAATVAECHRLLSATLRSAVRDRYISGNPCDGVRLPARRKKDTDGQTITRTDLTTRLLPAVPDRYRALVGLAGGTGLRWGECIGLRWGCVDLDAQTVSVIRVAVEVAGTVTTKAYPKSQAGRRTVPLPDAEANLLKLHRELVGPGPAGEVFFNTAGGPERRTLFRSRIWRPSLVRAGLLGQVTKQGDVYRASWSDATGQEWSLACRTEKEAISRVAERAYGGLRFHDLRHSYATWLISQGVPVNDVVSVMGHEHATTTLNIYTHRSADRDGRIRAALADFSLTSISPEGGHNDEKPPVEGS